MKISKRDLRKLNSYFYENPVGLTTLWKRDIIEFLTEKYNCIISCKNWNPEKRNKHYVKDIIKIINKYNLTNDDLYKYAITQNNLKQITIKLYNLNNLKETRDNKDRLITSGGCHYPSIRYPKKNRSRKTWANFYKLFPRLAEKDKWDGKTSVRYPKK